MAIRQFLWRRVRTAANNKAGADRLSTLELLCTPLHWMFEPVPVLIISFLHRSSPSKYFVLPHQHSDPPALDSKPPPELLDMEVERNTRAPKRSSRETAEPGGERARQKHYKVEEEEDEGEEEERHHRQQRGYGSRSSLPNLAVHFAELTNAVLRGIQDEGTSDKLYDEFMQNAKQKLICDLKITYEELYNFYNDLSQKMPDWLSESPPAKEFYTSAMDGRLVSKKKQVKQDLRAFVEQLGFVCNSVSYFNVTQARFSVELRLDVAAVPTTEARKHVKNRLLTLESVFQ